MEQLEALASTAAQVGQPAPSWQLKDAHGRLIESSRYAGKVVLINLFATWCVPCVWEVPDFVALQNKYWRSGLVIVGIATRQYASELLPFMKSNRVNYHICPSTDKVLWDFGVLQTGAIPTTAVIDRSGNVSAIWKYYHTKTFTENILIPLLAQPVPPLIVLPAVAPA